MQRGEQAFRIWKSLWLHYRDFNYDARKHNGRTKGGQTFDKRANKASFIKLEWMFEDPKKLGLFLIANFSEGNFNVPFEVTQDDIILYQEFEKRRQAQTYFYGQDISTIIERSRPDIPTIATDDRCVLFSSIVSRSISAETICIVDFEIPFLDNWYLNLKETLLGDLVMRLCKHRSFVKFNPEKCQPHTMRLINSGAARENQFVQHSSIINFV